MTSVAALTRDASAAALSCSPLSSPGWGHELITPRDTDEGNALPPPAAEPLSSPLPLVGAEARPALPSMSPMLLCMTPPECQAMLDAVEDAIHNAAMTPGRGATPGEGMRL